MAVHTSTQDDPEVLDLNHTPVRERRWDPPSTRVVRFWMLVFAVGGVAANQLGAWVGGAVGRASIVNFDAGVTPWAWSFLILASASYVAPGRLGPVLQAVASRLLSLNPPSAQPPARPPRMKVNPRP